MSKVSFAVGGRSGDLSIALAATDQLSIRGVIRQDILNVPIGGMKLGQWSSVVRLPS